MTILLVEDNKAFERAALNALAAEYDVEAGRGVGVVRDFVHASAELNFAYSPYRQKYQGARPFDVVLTDLLLPNSTPEPYKEWLNKLEERLSGELDDERRRLEKAWRKDRVRSMYRHQYGMFIAMKAAACGVPLIGVVTSNGHDGPASDAMGCLNDSLCGEIITIGKSKAVFLSADKKSADPARNGYVEVLKRLSTQ